MKAIRVSRQQLVAGLLILASLGVAIIAIMPPSRAESPAALPASGAARIPDLSGLPLAFEPNVGQSDQAVSFLAHGRGGMLFFTPSEVALSLTSGADTRKALW